jgi:predicted dehydrogenase
MELQTSRKQQPISRRSLLGGAVAAGWATTVLPRHVLGGGGRPSPNDKLNIAGIGVGGQGGGDISNVSSENIVALCDVDDARAADTFKKFPNAKRYKDFRAMLEKEKHIDAVVVATPDHTHAVAAMMAVKMGKHVYCEKPLTHTIYEARKLTEAARDAKVATQMGNQANSMEGVRQTCEWIWDGAIGNVREVHVWSDRPGGRWPQGVDRPTETPPVPSTLDWDLWLGPAPNRPYHPIYVPFKWRGFWDFGTGPLGDMGSHNLAPVFWALKLKYPTSVEASSTAINAETLPLAALLTFEFPARGDMPPVKLHWYDGGLLPPQPDELEPGRSLPHDDGVIFVGDKGILLAEGWGAQHPRLLPESRMKGYKQPPKTLPRSPGHHRQWIEACKHGTPTSSNFEVAGPLTECTLLGTLALRTGKVRGGGCRIRQKLYWDGPNMKVTNDPAANELLHFKYRHGWTL